MTCSAISQNELAQPARSHKALFSTRILGVFSVAAAIIFFASSAAPTPLFHIYQENFGLSPAMITIIFAAYAFSVLAALLTAGALSDYIGRRPVIFASLLMNVAAMAMFFSAHSANMLIAARVMQGFATGAATTALGAAILDTNRTFGALLNSMTTFLGLTLGALGSGALVAFAPHPTKLVYAILAAISAAGALLVWNMPETATRKRGAVASLRPQVKLPAQARRSLAQVSPVNIAAWGLGGFNFSLMPSLVRVATGLTSPFIGALAVAALVFSAAVAVAAMRNQPPARALHYGSLLLVSGVLGILAGVHLQNAPVMLTGASAAGFGFGAAFSGSMRTLLPLVAPGERAGLLATFYVESYLAFSLPAILTGFAAPRFGLLVTTYGFGAVLVALSFASMLAFPKVRVIAMG
jgi:MFS family permease